MPHRYRRSYFELSSTQSIAPPLTPTFLCAETKASCDQLLCPAGHYSQELVDNRIECFCTTNIHNLKRLPAWFASPIFSVRIALTRLDYCSRVRRRTAGSPVRKACPARSVRAAMLRRVVSRTTAAWAARVSGLDTRFLWSFWGSEMVVVRRKIGGGYPDEWDLAKLMETSRPYAIIVVRNSGMRRWPCQRVNWCPGRHTCIFANRRSATDMTEWNYDDYR